MAKRGSGKSPAAAQGGSPPAALNAVDAAFRSRSHRFLFALSAVVIAAFVSLLLVEVTLRVFSIRPVRFEKSKNLAMKDGVFVDAGQSGGGLIKRPSRVRNQGVMMGEWTPGAVFKTVYSSNPRGTFDPDNSITSVINEDGYRGPRVPVEKPPGVYRIIGIGDSFTFGIGVREPDTFLRKLELRLNSDSRTTASRFEVLNTGVEGYNTTDEVITLEHRWMAYDPDLVLLTFYLNDAYSDFTFLNRGEELGIYLPQESRAARTSYLWDLVEHTIAVRRQSRSIQAFYRSRFFAQPKQVLEDGGKKADWNGSRRALAHAANLARSREIRFGVVIFPELYALDESYPFKAVHELVAGACKELGIPVLDLLPAFAGKRDKDLWVHPSDHHPNEKAHDIAAGAIDKFVRHEFLH